MSTHDDDKSMFIKEMSNVKRHQHDGVPPYRSRPKAIARQLELDNETVLVDMMSDHYFASESETGEELIFKRPGVQDRTFKKLRRGHYSRQAELDLHGFTVIQAKEALLRFLHHCRQHHIVCVRIIHGKGKQSPGREPVLKGKINHWLRQKDEILAFCSAPTQDGGSGAIYVLLKRSKP